MRSPPTHRRTGRSDSRATISPRSRRASPPVARVSTAVRGNGRTSCSSSRAATTLTHVPSVLCHNDLVAANVLDDGDLVLVDFEYAVRSAPVLDLAGLAGLNDYGERACRELLDAYHGEGPAQISLAELQEIVRMVRLVAYFWARLGELRVADSASYSELAAELELKLN